MSNIETLHIDRITPYWRNPRQINDEAVEKVAESIEKFGYQQPIIVDAEHVIIAGHTRYKALRKLGRTEVPVIVSDLDSQRANEYRVIDNRSGEYTGWDEDLLMQELREFSEASLESYFPDMDLGLDFDDLDPVGAAENEAAAEAVSGQLGNDAPVDTIEFTCTNCFSPVHVAAHKVVEMADDYREGR